MISTFAWFSVANTVTPKQTITSDGTLSFNNKSANTADLVFTVTCDPSASTALDLTDNTGASKYWDSALGAPVVYTPTKRTVDITYTVTCTLGTHDSTVTLEAAMKQAFADHPNIYVKIDLGADVFAVKAAKTDDNFPYDTAANTDIYLALSLPESYGASSQALVVDSHVTASIRNNNTSSGQAYASAATLYDEDITASVGYSVKALGDEAFAFVGFAS